MRITELFTAQSIALDEALTDQEQIISRLVELQATHGNITDKEAYKKALYAREAEGSTYVDNGITVPHAKTNVVTRPSLAALRLSSPVQYNAEDDGTPRRHCPGPGRLLADDPRRRPRRLPHHRAGAGFRAGKL